MKGKLSYIARFLILFTAFFFQSSPIMERLSVSEVTPNLMFILLMIYALYLKDTEVFAYTLIFGSMTDLLFGKIYGVTTILLIVFVCIYILLKKYIYAENKISVVIYFMLSTLLYELCFLLINSAIWHEAVFTTSAIKLILVKCVYNTLVALPLFHIAAKVRILRQEVRS